MFKWLRSLLSPQKDGPLSFEVSTPEERLAAARKVYPVECSLTTDEKNAVIASLTLREIDLLIHWELENPRPEYPWIRDWARSPEDPYE
ncbi:hypothetical protein [Caudoviricetes sp.]|nr:hypothetical protein [Caudoviricetes sp.]